jgi:hypothetical protein
MYLIDVETLDEWMYPTENSDPKELLEPSFYVLSWVTSHDGIPFESDLETSQRFLTNQERNASTTEEGEGFP